MILRVCSAFHWPLPSFIPLACWLFTSLRGPTLQLPSVFLNSLVFGGDVDWEYRACHHWAPSYLFQVKVGLVLSVLHTAARACVCACITLCLLVGSQKPLIVFMSQLTHRLPVVDLCLLSKILLLCPGSPKRLSATGCLHRDWGPCSYGEIVYIAEQPHAQAFCPLRLTSITLQMVSVACITRSVPPLLSWPATSSVNGALHYWPLVPWTGLQLAPSSFSQGVPSPQPMLFPYQVPWIASLCLSWSCTIVGHSPRTVSSFVDSCPPHCFPIVLFLIDLFVQLLADTEKVSVSLCLMSSDFCVSSKYFASRPIVAWIDGWKYCN